MNTLPTTDWIGLITAAWNRSRDEAILVGQYLLQCKAELPHGSFQAMIKGNLPFGVRMANKLMVVASDRRINDPKNALKLPTSPSTLYELARLKDIAWDYGMEQGLINPDMERSQVQQISRITSNIQPADPEAKQLKRLMSCWKSSTPRVQREFLIWTEEDKLSVFNLRAS